ncbi:hypothetical protein ACL02T_17875 [Pseudonocardia sp. RS010]|uniref:hypothetical protein n=1 Tax=Pseudonocardia sp. RS010 TaxID=3385979 RepID=UPI0039A3E71F
MGGGPGALAVAEIASGLRVGSLVVGHAPNDGHHADEPVVLDPAAVAALEPNGVLDVLRPFLAQVDPPAISPRAFEVALRQHCAADFNVTLYDSVEVREVTRPPAGGEGVCEAVLSDGRSRWDLEAQALIDTADYPKHLSEIVNRAAADVTAFLSASS